MMTTIALPRPVDTSSDGVSRRGPRQINADAVATRTGLGRTAFVVADGIGDHLLAARAARVAAGTAAATAVREGAAAGLLAARRELHAQFDQERADCVLVVAVLPPVDRPEAHCDVAWVGDCRAYRWNGRVLQQVTTDHTLAEFWRNQDRPVTARMEHVVMDSVRTATEADLGRASFPFAAGRLLLCTDGVHKALDITRIKAVLADSARPGEAANTLVDTAHRTGGTDNATAIVADRHLA
ncbi:PP2C family protein-serine/threonine phosphatase [Amycolatopsis suaedae]|uniref:Serine/threonine protein phosphatase n=1 Tax=Amycolatopsis suaedae TaxID=2510978 RepID=A0A4Q7J1Q0_9PSEU|nr:protein phosphatase 2C domain-containing protein [Amycolatopsis suaedae]RZQ60777.1 serine/threonine protein phosphatase [Amycolatopsis suaedae]